MDTRLNVSSITEDKESNQVQEIFPLTSKRLTALAEAFCSSLAPAIRLKFDQVPFEKVVQKWVKTIETDWPNFPSPAESFMRFIAQSLVPGRDSADHLNTLQVSDLYLAYLCTRSDQKEQAIFVFKKRVLPELIRFLSRLNYSTAQIEQIKAHLLERLFVGHADKEPLIEQYIGRCTLSEWLCVIACRAARRFELHAREQQGGEESKEKQDLLKQVFKEPLLVALKEAFQSLSYRQRAILQYHYLDQLTVDQIAQIYKVERVSVSLWLSEARSKVRACLRRYFVEQFDLSPVESDRLIRLFNDQPRVSLSNKGLLFKFDKGM
jgi:RNA polymerase sigma-70 factor